MAGLALRAVGVGRVATERRELEEPGQGQVRVVIHRCGICGSDLHWFAGRMPLPDVCPGHEMSGVVDAVGSGVDDTTIGDRVTIEPIRRCGSCERCLAGDYHLCRDLALFGVHLPGGMASHVTVPAYCLHRVPDHVDMTIAALTEPLAVAVHALRLAAVGKHSRVLVLGAGTIGLVTIAAARHLGAETVAVTARYPQQKSLAERLGCNEVLAPENPRTRLRPNVVVETVGGHARTVADGVEAVAPGGTVVIAGLFESTPAFDPMVMMMKEVRMVASMVYNRGAAGSDFDAALEILARRGDDLRALVTHEVPLTEATRGFEIAADKATGAVKVLLAPTDAP